MRLVGVDVGGYKISAGLVVDEHVVGVTTGITNHNEEIVPQIQEQIDSVSHSRPFDGLGIGVPGPVIDLEEGMVLKSPNLKSIEGVRLKYEFGNVYGWKIPIVVNNDANCFALAESRFGAGRKYKNFVGVTLGTGFGAGIIIDGRLYSGKSGSAGEFGHIPIRGSFTIEDLCSGKFFKTSYGTTGTELYQRFETKKDPEAEAAFIEFGEHLGEALSLIAYGLDPEAIILGGAIARASPLFSKSMETSLKSRMQEQYTLPKVELSTLEHAGILGAAALCLDAGV